MASEDSGIVHIYGRFPGDFLRSGQSLRFGSNSS